MDVDEWTRDIFTDVIYIINTPYSSYPQALFFKTKFSNEDDVLKTNKTEDRIGVNM